MYDIQKRCRNWSAGGEVNPTPPGLLNHVLKCTLFKHLQGWGLHHLLGQPVPVHDHSFRKEIFPNSQSKPPLTQLEAVASRPISTVPSPYIKGKHSPCHQSLGTTSSPPLHPRLLYTLLGKRQRSPQAHAPRAARHLFLLSSAAPNIKTTCNNFCFSFKNVSVNLAKASVCKQTFRQRMYIEIRKTQILLLAKGSTKIMNNRFS